MRHEHDGNLSVFHGQFRVKGTERIDGRAREIAGSVAWTANGADLESGFRAYAGLTVDGRFFDDESPGGLLPELLDRGTAEALRDGSAEAQETLLRNAGWSGSSDGAFNVHCDLDCIR